jgi:predicted alpha-1,2-mannosidase
MKRLATATLFLYFSFNALSQNFVQYVNMFMGVKGEGSCVIGPQLPFGSINPSPDTPDGQTDGYNYSSKIRGFSQLHVSGTGGSGKYGQFLISPQIGIRVNEDGHDSEKSDEIAKVGYYKVKLNRYNIICEITPTHHSAIYRFTFPKSDSSFLLVDLAHNIPGDIAKRNGIYRGGYNDNGFVKIDVEKQLITGYGHYWGGWSAEPFYVYFAMKVSKQIINCGTWKNTVIRNGNTLEWINNKKERVGAYIRLSTNKDEKVYVKIAVSMKSIKNAVKFLKNEIPDWDFEKVRSNAIATWNKQLSKIKIEGASEEKKTIFYTSLYRTMMMPRNRTGDNPKSDSTIPYWDDQYCIWDTWKTDFPLQILINEDMVRDNILSFIERFRENGKVLDAFIAGNDKIYGWGTIDNPSYAKNQGGDNVDNVIADAYLKHVEGIDWREAYRILKHDADKERAAAYLVNNRGWIPEGTYEYGLDCSKSLEFAYNDFCVSQVAEGLGYKNDYEKYLNRSRKWKNLWNSKLESDGYLGFIDPKSENLGWLKFDPQKETVETSPGVYNRSFYEASSWEYSFFTPHDFKTLINLSGGKEKFVERLQYAFNNKMIDYSNEPSFLTPYCFIYAGRPDLTSFWVRKNFDNYTPDKFPGDEDSGAMGSWYVFSSMGFFPNAGQNIYLLGGPIFSKITIILAHGKKIIITADNLSKENIYVKSVELNGKKINRAWITHDEISNGATIKFIMGAKQSGWGAKNLPFVR